jgi:hypothetical protein
MNKAAYPLKLPNSIKQAAQRLAKEDGVSLNQWISSAVAQKVGSIETAADFFKQRATRRKGTGLMRFLVDAPDVPEEGNETALARQHPPVTARTTVSLSYRGKDGRIRAKRSKNTTPKDTVSKAKRA